MPRAGIVVSESFRRTRRTKGEAYVWLGVQKQTGRGERVPASHSIARSSMPNSRGALGAPLTSGGGPAFLHECLSGTSMVRPSSS